MVVPTVIANDSFVCLGNITHHLCDLFTATGRPWCKL